MTGIPGDIRAPMESDGSGNYRIVIPPAAVVAGTWRYSIEFPLDGQIHRMPPNGYRSFTVTVPVYHDHDYPARLLHEVTAETTP